MFWVESARDNHKRKAKRWDLYGDYTHPTWGVLHNYHYAMVCRTRRKGGGYQVYLFHLHPARIEPSGVFFPRVGQAKQYAEVMVKLERST